MVSDKSTKIKTEDLFEDTSVSDVISEAFNNLQLSEVGKVCLEARLKKSLTQEQASATLKVRVKIIKDFENGDNIDLPGLTYKIGFVRSYARLLGLDEDFLVKEFKLSLELVGYKQEYKFFTPKIENKNFMPIGVVFSSIVAVIIYSGWFYSERSKTTEISSNKILEMKNKKLTEIDNYIIVEENENDVSNPLVDNNNVKQVFALPDKIILNKEKTLSKEIYKNTDLKNLKRSLVEEKTFKNENVLDVDNYDNKTSELSAVANERDRSTEMVLKATGNSWVEIEDINGNILMTRLMRSGETYVVPNKSGLTFNTGNAGALSLSYGNITIPALGNIGEIISARPLKVEAFQSKQIIN